MSQFANKQSTARLRLVNPDGTPAARREVKADQVSHQFLFGCGAFDAVEMMKTQDEGKKEVDQITWEKVGAWIRTLYLRTLGWQ